MILFHSRNIIMSNSVIYGQHMVDQTLSGVLMAKCLCCCCFCSVSLVTSAQFPRFRIWLLIKPRESRRSSAPRLSSGLGVEFTIYTNIVEGWWGGKCRCIVTLFVSWVSIMKLWTCFSARLNSSLRDTTATRSAVQPAPCNAKRWRRVANGNKDNSGKSIFFRPWIPAKSFFFIFLFFFSFSSSSTTPGKENKGIHTQTTPTDPHLKDSSSSSVATRDASTVNLCRDNRPTNSGCNRRFL